MLDEKPKNKAKPKRISRSQKILLAAIVVVAAAGFVFLVYFAIPTRLQLNDVQAVTISNHWMGLSDIAPIESSYNLRMIDESLVGLVTFSHGMDDMTIVGQLNDDPVSIPPEVVIAFLEKLEEAQLKPGQYSPRIEWTDDYPSIAITLQTANGTIEIYSESQGEEHIPWGANVAGQAYTINSGIPAQALTILDPYLKREVLDELMNEARAGD